MKNCDKMKKNYSTITNSQKHITHAQFRHKNGINEDNCRQKCVAHAQSRLKNGNEIVQGFDISLAESNLNRYDTSDDSSSIEDIDLVKNKFCNLSLYDPKQEYGLCDEGSGSSQNSVTHMKFVYRKGIDVENNNQKSVECTIDSIKCNTSDDSSCDEGSIETLSLNYSKDKYGLTKEDYRNFKISKNIDAVRSELIHNLKNSQEKNKSLDMFALRHWKHQYTSNLKSTVFKNSKYYEWAVLRQTSKSKYKCNCSVGICQHILLMETLGENDLKFAMQAPTNGTLFKIRGSFCF